MSPLASGVWAPTASGSARALPSRARASERVRCVSVARGTGGIHNDGVAIRVASVRGSLRGVRRGSTKARVLRLQPAMRSSALVRGFVLTVALAILILTDAAQTNADDGTVDSLPTLAWPLPIPKDWLNVQTSGSCDGDLTADVNVPARGDGQSDDTAAIQRCFDKVSNETQLYTVYLPAGTYKITKTLRLSRGLGILIVGDGESTRLVWGGEKNGRLLISDGLSRSRFVGLVFDGQDTAAIGFEHDSHSPGLFETRIRHQNNKFVNFLKAGIRIGMNRTDHKLETSEVLYENSVFANNGNQDEVAFNCTKFGGCGGVVILNFNDCESHTTGTVRGRNQKTSFNTCLCLETQTTTHLTVVTSSITHGGCTQTRWQMCMCGTVDLIPTGDHLPSSQVQQSINMLVPTSRLRHQPGTQCAVVSL